MLADYVLALFKNDITEEELVKMLNEQLVDFLENSTCTSSLPAYTDTAAFVDKAVSALKTHAYKSDSRKREADAMDEGNEQEPKRQAYASEDAAVDAALGSGATDARPRRNARVPKGWCRDYHNVGYCSRGSSCKFTHSDDSIMGQPMPFMPPPPFPMGAMPDAAAGFPMPPPEQMAAMMMQMQQMAAGAMMGGPPMGGGRGSGLRGRGRGRGGARGGGPSAHHAPRSQDTLVIENIPAEFLDLVPVNDYFKRFGTITNIQVDKPGSRAVVSYATPAEAEAAHKNPEVIFGNRFVKVYFQRLERLPPSKPHYMTDKGSNVYLAPSLRDSAPRSVTQVNDDEKRRLLELRKKKQELLNMQLEEQKALLEKLSAPDLTPQGRKSIMVMLEKLGSEIKGATEMLKKDVMETAAKHHEAEGDETTEQLQAKLAHLRREAATLGLDAAGRPMRGGAPRGCGAFRGRGAFHRSMTLDNRTTRVGVTDLPLDYDADKLRAHFEQFGPCSLENVDGGVIATYTTRANGERAMRAGGSVPEIGSVRLAWVEAPVVPTTPAATQAADAPAGDAAPTDALDADGAERENWKR